MTCFHRISKSGVASIFLHISTHRIQKGQNNRVGIKDLRFCSKHLLRIAGGWLVIKLSRQYAIRASLWYTSRQVVALCDTKVDSNDTEKGRNKPGTEVQGNAFPRNFNETVRAKFIILSFPNSKSWDDSFDAKMVRPTHRHTFIPHLSSCI